MGASGEAKAQRRPSLRVSCLWVVCPVETGCGSQDRALRAAVTPAAAGAVYRGANRAAETRSLFRALEIKPTLAPERFFRLALMAWTFGRVINLT
jgi:hypothetical protein